MHVGVIIFKRKSLLKSVLLLFCFCICFAFPASADETVIKDRKYDVLRCNIPSASVIVGSVTCKAQACRTDKDLTPRNAFLQSLMALSGQPRVDAIGDGLGDMLLTALKTTGCVELLEREGLVQMKQEMALAGVEFKPPTADYMVMGSVNSIKVENSNTNLGGGYIPVIGSVDIKKTSVALGFDVRLVTVSTGRIIFSKTYEGSNNMQGFGVGGAASWGNVGFGGAYSNLKGTPLEEVARDIIIRVTTDLIGTIQKAQSVPASTEQLSGLQPAIPITTTETALKKEVSP